jgi:hypothetical protein
VKDHQHAEAYEDETVPDEHGSLTVEVRCECGELIRTYTDSIL